MHNDAALVILHDNDTRLLCSGIVRVTAVALDQLMLQANPPLNGNGGFSYITEVDSFLVRRFATNSQLIVSINIKLPEFS